ncbi:helix-turn-helix domain-containing protein [Secundilactobacillus kimchicus]|uniref:HTH cro/C1-type domain-containing protein n=1 Tax=Secundilactobacillus kimchicus JCM 15530 TaxID=1302272 RepID=A0A0R1HW82_9LACO|nr:helix-turn-helix transcriptional regulator [Secundilactobacillus kimchicus]KRK48132.1 hypothetical protein FC96_GL001864 [Secundilactobacillus kimchicus JCM 15530]
MIANRLSILIAERHLKASRISKDTGIARSTLNSITSNTSKMIQLETINTLCQYLNVSPNEFFEFLPFDVEFSPDFTLDNIQTNLNMPNDSYVLNDFTIKGIEIDGFLKQSFIRETTGFRERTFDLTIRQIKDFDYMYLSSEDSLYDTNLEFDVLLGHTKDNDSYTKDLDGFTELWDKELPTSFQSAITNEIMNQTTDLFRSQVIAYLAEQGINDLDQEARKSFANAFKSIHFLFSFSFDNAYKPDVEPASLTISFDSLPF